MFLRSENEFVAKTEFGIVLEYFCEVGMILRLRLNLELSKNIFVKLKLDLECFCPGGEKRGIGLRKLFVQEEKGRKGVGLRIICPSKREKKSKVRQVRRGVRSPVRLAAKRIITASLSQVGSKITACCRFMQPITIKLVAAIVWQQEPIGKSSR